MTQACEVVHETTRPKAVVTIGPDETLAAAGAMMRDHGVGSLVVVDAEERIVGILSERDVVTRVLCGTAEAPRIPISQVMTREVVCCPPGASMRDVQALMAESKVRHVPVVEAGRLIGMISAREVMAYQHAQDVAMRDAAEQVAKIYSSLRSLDYSEVVEMIAREVPGVLGADRSVLCVPEHTEGDEVFLRIQKLCCAATDEDLRAREDARLALATSIPVEGQAPESCGQAGAGSDSLLIPLGFPARPGEDDASLAQALAYLCMCGFREDSGLARDVTLYKISLLRETLGANLINARLYEEYRKVRDAVVTDTLTGVGTRRLLEDKLAEECRRSRRYRRAFSLAFVDIDHFKLINDRMGHAVGDQVLTHIGECMREEKRTTDTLARFGGDEFVLLMPETTLDQAAVLMERIASRLQGFTMPDMPPVTLSVGLVQQEEAGSLEPDELLQRADLALYQAKRRGRNRIELWDRVTDSLRHKQQVDSERIKALRSRVTALLAKSREMFMQSIRGLVHALDARDPYTRSHSENVTRLAVGIAEQMNLGAEQIGVIRRAAMIHDVGKIGVPDHVLLKPGRLDEEERRLLEEHPVIGVRILDQMGFLERELPLVRQHHERWDGEGYPDSIRGTGICLGARVLAAADALDAITSTRNYHEARGLPEAMAIIENGAGGQFDPAVVDSLKEWIARLESAKPDGEPLTTRELLDSKRDCGMAA